MAAYVDGKVDRVEIFYNGYVSPLTQEVRRETLLPLQQATILEARRGRRGRRRASTGAIAALVEYEPEPEEILQRLVPDYVEISIYRALLESTASEHGARMTAMRNASENAGGGHRGPDARDEPRPPGRDHPGDHGSRRRRRRRWSNPRSNPLWQAATKTKTTDTNAGRIEEIQGVVIEAVFPDELPEINNAIDGRPRRPGHARLRGAAAPRRRPRPRASRWTPPTAWRAGRRSSTPAGRSPCRSAR